MMALAGLILAGAAAYRSFKGSPSPAPGKGIPGEDRPEASRRGHAAGEKDAGKPGSAGKDLDG